ncbi:YkvA family protein, partial [Candidatus Kryptobacter tengchongensis]|uniref:YkvA family protein n=1 Tax=Kryptobacter tengchongensis TaxID=1643429 RepID=UPI0007075CBB
QTAMRNYEQIGEDVSIYIPQKSTINEIERISENITDREVEYVEQNFWQKLARLKGNINFKRDLIALYKFMKDPAVSFFKKAIAISALLYFILPIDSIPDLSPIVGFLDDIGIVAMVVKYLSRELERYY